MEVSIVSGAIMLHGGFHHNVFYLFYYHALAGCAAIFSSLRMNLGLAIMVSAIYITISVSIGYGLALAELDEKTLIARVVVMYGLVTAVTLASRFERRRFNEVIEREQAPQQERAELSLTIHNTTAQSVYTVGLGLETSRSLAGGSNPALTAALDSTAGSYPVRGLGSGNIPLTAAAYSRIWSWDGHSCPTSQPSRTSPWYPLN